MTDTLTSMSEYSEERLTLRKSAKLRHRTLVQNLFGKGTSVYAGPLRVIFRTLAKEDLTASFKEAVPDLLAPVQMMITVPKKKRRHAVDRVLIRRRIREAFRLQYRPLRKKIEEDGEIRTLSLAIIYMHAENCSMEKISAAMATVLVKLEKKLMSGSLQQTTNIQQPTTNNQQSLL